MPTARKKKSSSTARKKSPQKPRKSTTRRKKNSRKKSFKWSRLLGLLMVLLVIVGLVYAWYLDRLIEQRFDGETWARPSRVFARPLELFSGLKLSPQQLTDELKLADYQPVKKISQPGQFTLQGNVVDIYSREFHFADHHQQEEQVRIRFDDNEIQSLEYLSLSNELLFFQLTPAVIGSYLPGNDEDRLVIGTEDIPQALIDILLAVEDHRFYQHLGISPLSIIRALMANVKAGRTVQGGSTLTQQLAKNMFLTPERSIIRKLNEALMSLMLEFRFDKDVILTAYINEVFLLQQKKIAVHGFAQASKLLFKQPLKYLSREKLALLVAMVKGPSVYNPLVHPQNALKRRNQVLKVVLNDGQISSDEYQRLIIKPLGVVKKLPPVNPFPAYLDLVKKQLKKNYSADDLAEKGLSIFTTFDPLKQRQLERGLTNGLNRFSNNTIQTAVLIADYLSGDLLAMVGDRNTSFPGYNRAILAQRPVGSLIKPMVLYGLLNNGKTLASIVEDRPIRIKQSNDQIWSPQNYDKKIHGEMTLYRAFVNSYNLPFVHLGLENNGLKTLTENLEKIKLVRQQVIYPSLLLGATVMTPFEVTQMYQVIANSGYFTPLTTIRQVMDNENNVLTSIPLYSAEVFDRQTMIQVQRALIGVAEEGTARYLKTRYSEKTFAGKTGTTNDLRDSWFAGFSDRYLAVVWLGDDDNQPIDLTGASGALRIWADIMQQMDDASIKLGAEPGLEWQYINSLTGGKTGKHCNDSVLLPFTLGSKPNFSSDCDANYLEKGINWLQQQFQ